MKSKLNRLMKPVILLALAAVFLLPVSVLAAQGNPGLANFEAGNSGGWVEGSSTGAPVIMPAFYGGLAHGGQWAAWLGGTHNDLSYIEKSIVVPAEKPALSYWQWISSEGMCGADKASLLVNGSTIKTFDLCLPNESQSWEFKTVDLSAFAGQNITLRFEVQTDGADFGSLFIDDLMVSQLYKVMLPIVRR